MKGFEGYKLQAVQQRLRLQINTIVERHRTAGVPLTWKLLHEIEREALQALEQAGDLGSTYRSYIRRMRSSRWGYIPKLDEPAQLAGHKDLPVAVTLIHEAYRSCH
ncbi:Protein of unknown function [Noviherbaspirillum humi]|uniref:Uncharacterized protein n=1 Tax=Noviherbaspirillum humi TaxID=1688639 RepID=A0A239HNI5_9BURK|nr:DUF2471 family protein [Noviherbaspirillum humi]SNS82919.1 Protein of unknown function [Noviherbaspirillum humi]